MYWCLRPCVLNHLSRGNANKAFDATLSSGLRVTCKLKWILSERPHHAIDFNPWICGQQWTPLSESFIMESKPNRSHGCPNSNLTDLIKWLNQDSCVNWSHLFVFCAFFLLLMSSGHCIITVVVESECGSKCFYLFTNETCMDNGTRGNLRVKISLYLEKLHYC